MTSAYFRPIAMRGAGNAVRQAVFQAARDGDLEGVKRQVTASREVLHLREADNCSLLHVANSAALVEFLVHSGLKVNDTTTSSKETPLHHAADRGNCEVALSLILLGAQVDATDCLSSRPLHHACSSAHLAMVELLLEQHAEVNATDQVFRSPLHWASRGGSADVVQLLMKFGGDVSRADFDSDTPLHVICRMTNSPDHLRSLIIARLLDAAPQLINAKNANGFTPLSLCVAHSALCTSLLLQRGASVSIVDSCQRTVLHLACQSVTAVPATIECLIAAGVPINAEDGAARTALHYATVRNPALLTPLLAAKPSLNDFTPSVLSVAVLTGNIAVIKQLIASGAKPRVSDIVALMKAPAQFDLSILRLLLDAGAPVHEQVASWGSPVVLCACAGRSAAVAMLLEAGAHLPRDAIDTMLRNTTVQAFIFLEMFLMLGAPVPLRFLKSLSLTNSLAKLHAVLPFIHDMYDLDMLSEILATWQRADRHGFPVKQATSDLLMFAPPAALGLEISSLILLGRPGSFPDEVLVAAQHNASRSLTMSKIP